MEYTLPEYDIFKEWAPQQHFQRIDKYSNYLHDEGRLETWDEVITRATDILRMLSNNKLADFHYQRMFELMYTGEIAPSMRLLSMSQEAVKRCNTVIYNCSFGLCDRLTIFGEALYMGMSGMGVAYSVEQKNISKLPEVKMQTGGIDNLIIEDSQVAWAKSVHQLINALFAGYDINFDYSKIRPSGSPLKVKGGFASGPQPLKDIHNALRRIVKGAQGRQLRSIEVHDMMCWMLEAGISGATRRSAGLVLFDSFDDEMLNCKYMGFWEHPEHKVRANCNNTVVYENEMTMDDIEQATSPWFNGLGEPGLFRRDNAIRTAPSWRKFPDIDYVGINSCGEISLSPSPVDGSVEGGGWHFCNLSSVHVREHDTINSLEEKVYYATIIGDIQSLATNFDFLSSGTKVICDRDRLLGVSLIGYAGHKIIRDTQLMTHLRKISEVTDLLFSEQFNVPRSAAITTVKPAGNSSQLYYTENGMNIVLSRFQQRNYTVNKNSTMHKFLEDAGVPRYDYAGRDYASWFAFPLEHNEDVLTLENTNAIGQMEIWKEHSVNWCHHNASCTITYKHGEEESIKQWLFDNQDITNALAFFPEFHSYGISPIMPLTEDEYKDMIEKYPVIDWSKYEKYETGKDERTKTVECGGGVCEIVYK